MGAVKIDKLSDLEKVDAHVRVTCLSCGHRALMDRRGVIQYFRHMKWNEYFEVAGLRFRCMECGHRGAHLRAEKLNTYERERPPLPEILSKDQMKMRARRERG